MANLTATFVLQSDRYSDESVLAAGNDNIASTESNTVTLALPAGFGDCLILDWQFYASSVDAILTSTNTYQVLGADSFILGLDAAVKDFAGTAPLLQTAITGGAYKFAGYSNPAQPVLWREVAERFFLDFPPLDQGVGNTTDVRYYVRVKRLRNTGAAS